MEPAAPNQAPRRSVSFLEGAARTTLSTLAVGSITYCLVHIGQQVLRVGYRTKYRVMVPSLISAAAAAYTTAWKMREHNLLPH